MNRKMLMAFGCSIVLSACAGDSMTRDESPVRRDNWYVQTVRVSVDPERHHAWCVLENEHFSVSVHSVPGVVIIPVRGDELKASCYTQRGWSGTKIVSRTVPEGRQPARGTYPRGRSETSWPDEIVVSLEADRRIREVIERENDPRHLAPVQRPR